jgi:hypothetical protein
MSRRAYPTGSERGKYKELCFDLAIGDSIIVPIKDISRARQTMYHIHGDKSCSIKKCRGKDTTPYCSIGHYRLWRIDNESDADRV